MSKSKHYNYRHKQKIFEVGCEDKLTLPQDFLCDFEENFGTINKQKYIESFTQNSVRGMRLNALKGNVECFENFYKTYQTIPYFPNAYYVDTEQKLGNSILHHCGAFYVQEPSSMTPVASVKNYDFFDKCVLDLCASPGGKSTQIASLMQNDGVLLSNEIDPLRAKTLFSNIERLGIKNAIVTNEKPQNLAKNFANTFDYIFVDAPCSGEGMFRKDSTAIKEWNKNLKFYNQQRQKQILDYANVMLKQNGILVYSTCTYNVIENEQVVDYMCQTFGYEILPICDDVQPFAFKGLSVNDNENLSKTAHFFPFVMKGEGQFVAVLKKTSSNENFSKKVKPQKLNTSEQKIVEKFIGENLINFDIANYDFLKVDTKICVIKKHNFNLNLSNLKVLTCGVILGEIIKDRLNVYHQFYSAYGQNFRCFVNLDYASEILSKFIKGEELDIKQLENSQHIIEFNIELNHYGVIMASGYSLGGFKCVDGKLKNYYPKALRINKK